MKKLVFLLLMVCAVLLAETVILDSSRDSDMFNKVGNWGVDWDMDWRDPPELKNGLGTRSGGFCVFSKPFDVDPNKTYQLSGEFRILNASMPISAFQFGFNPLDENNKTIWVFRVNATSPQIARLVVPALEGDTEIILEDLGWQIPVSHLILAFDAEQSFSDLPSKTTSGRIVENGIRRLSSGNVAIRLSTPLKGSVPANTYVRIHADGPTYQYTASGPQPGTEWVKWQGTIKGYHQGGRIGADKWYPGTKTARIFLRCFDAGMADAKLEFRNIRLISNP